MSSFNHWLRLLGFMKPVKEGLLAFHLRGKTILQMEKGRVEGRKGRREEGGKRQGQGSLEGLRVTTGRAGRLEEKQRISLNNFLFFMPSLLLQVSVGPSFQFLNLFL